MTYLYAALGMAMLIPILASLEMAGKLLEQQVQLEPSVNLATSSSDVQKVLMRGLAELRQANMPITCINLGQEIKDAPETNYDIETEYIKQKIEELSFEAYPSPPQHSSSLLGGACWSYSNDAVKSTHRFIVSGVEYPPSANSPLQAFGLLVCPGDHCSFEDQ